MSNTLKFADYDLHIGERPLHDMTAFLRKCGKLKQNKFSPISIAATVEEDVMTRIREDCDETSGHFEKNRVPVRAALRTIVKFAFDRFSLPRNGGVDIGSGASGEMVEELLPRDCDKNTWTQLEVNPGAVEQNRRRHPGSTIVEASYQNMGTPGLKLVTGLSSLDATLFLENAIASVREALTPGGFLLHVQDVRPGHSSGHKAVTARGQKAPYTVETVGDTDEVVTFRVGTPSGLKTFVSGGELFRRRLGEAIKNDPQMELLSNNWVTTTRPVADVSRWYFLNTFLKANRNFFDLSENQIEEVSAIITVARKK